MKSGGVRGDPDQSFIMGVMSGCAFPFVHDEGTV